MTLFKSTNIRNICRHTSIILISVNLSAKFVHFYLSVITRATKKIKQFCQSA